MFIFFVPSFLGPNGDKEKLPRPPHVNVNGFLHFLTILIPILPLRDILDIPINFITIFIGYLFKV